MEQVVIIRKYKEGELVWKRESKKDPYYVLSKYCRRLYRLGYFLETGLDDAGHLFVVGGTGDNCIKFGHSKEVMRKASV
jgi:hypothetical protein